ncbi:hypothetical protein LJC35_06485 [Parabacteroides sp. OttesenSCG-928-N08]|nr:hypothetical protein [Parabacteroides sp. OttesenSCG-928-N08]
MGKKKGAISSKKWIEISNQNGSKQGAVLLLSPEMSLTTYCLPCRFDMKRATGLSKG